MNLRILYIVFNRTGEGTFWRAFHLGRVLSAMGHSVELLCNSPHSRLRTTAFVREGVRIIETPDLFPRLYLSGWDPWNVFKRLAYTNSKSYDLVHAFESRPGVLFPALLQERRGAAMFMDWADWFGKGGSVEERSNLFIRSVLRPVETYFENHFRRVPLGTTVINQTLYDRVINMGIPPTRVMLLPNGCDTRLPVIEKVEARERLGMDKDHLIVGYVGRAFEKDARLMAESFNQLANQLRSARLLLIGNFNRPILDWIDDPNTILASGRVSVEKLHTYISACDVCWLPLVDSNANRGRQPMKLNDYLTAGRPIVSTPVGDIGTLMVDQGIGCVSAQNPGSFATTTLQLLENPERARELGRAARDFAENELDWEFISRELLKHYHACTEIESYALS
jgi:glycosyltransferase involved in cell wall biosynthesis